MAAAFLRFGIPCETAGWLAGDRRRSLNSILPQERLDEYARFVQRLGSQLGAERGQSAEPNNMGTSVENADYCDRIGVPRSATAANRFISFESLFGSDVPVNLNDVDWEIVGGESGFRARPMAEEWVEGIRITCKRQDVPFFFKQ